MASDAITDGLVILREDARRDPRIYIYIYLAAFSESWVHALSIGRSSINKAHDFTEVMNPPVRAGRENMRRLICYLTIVSLFLVSVCPPPS